jgi:hypothetical protein
MGLNSGETLVVFQTIGYPSVSPLTLFSKESASLASILTIARSLLPREGK